MKRLLAYLLPLLLGCSPSIAFTLDDERAAYFFAQFRYATSVAASVGQHRQHVVDCDFYGFLTRCVVPQWSKSEEDELWKLEEQYQAASDLAGDIIGLAPLWAPAEWGSVREAVHAVERKPPFVPFDLYGLASGLPDAANEKAYDPIYFSRVFVDISDAAKSQLQATLPAFPDFSQLPSDFDPWGYALRAFPSFAAVAETMDGARVLEFWRGFAEYSANLSGRNCEEGCSVVVPASSTVPQAKLLELCTTFAINGVLGAPQDCVPVVLEFNGTTFLRVAENWTLPEGLGDGGDADIVCSNPDKIADWHIDVDRSLATLFDIPQSRYLLNWHDDDEIRIINRFHPSVLFSGFEFSSMIIIFDGDPGDVTIYSTVALNGVESFSQDEYRLINAGQQFDLIAALLGAMPRYLDCSLP